jgi:RHS repeat-associated protein
MRTVIRPRRRGFAGFVLVTLIAMGLIAPPDTWDWAWPFKAGVAPANPLPKGDERVSRPKADVGSPKGLASEITGEVKVPVGWSPNIENETVKGLQVRGGKAERVEIVALPGSKQPSVGRRNQKSVGELPIASKQTLQTGEPPVSSSVVVSDAAEIVLNAGSSLVPVEVNDAASTVELEVGLAGFDDGELSFGIGGGQFQASVTTLVPTSSSVVGSSTSVPSTSVGQSVSSVMGVSSTVPSTTVVSDSGINTITSSTSPSTTVAGKSVSSTSSTSTVVVKRQEFRPADRAYVSLGKIPPAIAMPIVKGRDAPAAAKEGNGEKRPVGKVEKDKDTGTAKVSIGEGVVTFRKADAVEGAVSFEPEKGVSIGLRPLSGEAVEPELDANGKSVKWRGAMADGSDLVQTATEAGLKGEIVLQASPVGDAIWNFELLLSKGLVPEQLWSGEIEIRDKSGRVVGVLPVGHVVDVKGKDSIVEATLQFAGGDRWVVAYAVDVAWLDSPERTYPVKVDPSVGFGAGGGTKFRINSNQSGNVAAYYDTANYNLLHIESGTSPWTWAHSGQDAVWITPNLTGWQPGMQAILWLRRDTCDGSGAGAGSGLWLNAATSAWSSATLSWTNQPSMSPGTWIPIVGADYSWIGVNITSQLQTWNGGNGGTPGFRLWNPQTDSDCRIEGSSYIDISGTANTAPTVTLGTPAAGATGVAAQPTLTAAASDPDGAATQYLFEIATPNFGNATFYTHSGWTANSSWTPPAFLFNQQVEWRVRVWDSYNAEVWSAPRFFVTQAPPGPSTAGRVAPSLGQTTVGSANGATVTVPMTGSVVGGVAPYTYMFFVHPDGSAAPGTPTVTVSSVTGTNATVSVQLGYAKKHFWQVVVTDANNNSVSSGYGDFTTRLATPNTVPVVSTTQFTPTNGATNATSPVSLTALATDAEGHALEYQFQLCLSNQCVTSLFGAATQSFVVNPGSAYTWSVRARDLPPAGSDPQLTSAFSAVRTFSTVAANNPPSAPTLVLPADNAQTTIRPSLQASSVDPDPGDVTEYRYELCAPALPAVGSGSTPGVIPSGTKCLWSTDNLAINAWTLSSWRVPFGLNNPASTALNQLDFWQPYEWRAWARTRGTTGTGVPSTLKRTVVPNLPATDDPGVGSLGWDPYVDFNVDDSENSGVSEGLGSFITSSTDATVASVAPGLMVSRTYNSRNRSVGVFGRGWSSNLDARVSFVPLNGTTVQTTDPVLVTMPDGRRHYFNRNSDWKYKTTADGFKGSLVATVDGSNLLTGFIFQTEERTKAIFDLNGRMQRLEDKYGNQLVYGYSGAVLQTITDQKSGRQLTVSMVAGKVTSVSSIYLAEHATTLTWTYSYVGDLLQQMCSPQSAIPLVDGCWIYRYDTGDRVDMVTKPKGNIDVELGYDQTSFTIGIWNLAPNPSFESGSTSWSSTGTGAGSGVVTTQGAAFGANSYLLNYGGAGSTAELRSSSITVDPGKRFTVSGRVKGTTTGRVVPVAYFYDSTNTLISSTQAGFGGDATWPTTSQFAAIRGQFRTPDTATKVQIGFQWPSAQGHNGNAVVDAVALEKGDGKVGRVAWRKNGMQEQTTFAYQANGFNLEVLTDDPSIHPVQTDTYNEKFQLIKRVDSGGLISRWEYDDKGFTKKFIDTANRTTTFTNDELGNKTVETDWLGRNKYWSFENTTYLVKTFRDERSSSVNDNTFLTQYFYNTVGDLTKTVDPVAGEWTRTFTDGTTAAEGGVGLTPKGLLLTETDRAGKIVTYKYDQLGNRVRIEDPAKGVSVYSFDPIGRIKTSARLWNGTASTVTSIFYDVRSQTRIIRGPLTANAVSGANHHLENTLDYDQNGNVIASTESDLVAGGDAPRITTMSYDNNDRTNRVTRAGKVIKAYHDALGRAFRVEDAQGVVTRTNFNARGLVDSVQIENYWDYPGATTRPLTIKSYIYDPNKPLPQTETDSVGRQVRNTWRSDDRLEKSEIVGYQNLDGSVRDLPMSYFEYDNIGNITLERRGSTTGNIGVSTTTRIFDPRGFISSQTQVETNRTTTYTYDSEGRQMTQTTGSFIATNEYWPGTGQLKGQTNNGLGGSYATYGYDQWGRLSTVTDANGKVTTNEYDGLDRPTKVLSPAFAGYDPTGQTAIASLVSSAETGYNTFGEVTHEKDPRGNVTVSSRDTFGRVQLKTHPTLNGQTPTESATYDLADNVLTATDRRNSTTTTRFDALGRANRFTQPIPGVGLTAPVTDILFNDAGEIIQQTDPNGIVTTFSYDKAGRTRSQTVKNVGYGVAGGTVGGSAGDLISRWNFDPNANDSSGNNNNAALLGGATIVSSGKTGNGLNVTGTSNSHAQAPNSTSLNQPTNGWSFSAWVKPTASTTNLAAIAARQEGLWSNDQFFVGVSNGAMQVYFNTTGQGNAFVNAGTSIPNGSWSHVALTYDGSNARIYKNGALMSTTPRTGTVTVSNRPVVIGGGANDNTPNTAQELFNGVIDDVCLHKRALTATEIATQNTCAIGASTSSGTAAPTTTTGDLTTTFDYNDFGAQTLVRDPLGNQTLTTYNGAGQPTLSVDPTGVQTTFTYKPSTGWQDSVVVAGTRRTVTGYDAAGRVNSTKVTNPAGTVTISEDIYTYDFVGNKKTHTRPSGGANGGGVDSFEYDSMNRIIQTTTDVGNAGVVATAVQKAGYDIAGKLVRVTDGNNNVTTMTHNSAGVLASLVEPSTSTHPAVGDRTWTVGYDAGVLPTSETRPGGVSVTRTFDALGRLSSETGSGSGISSAGRSFTYDAGSRMISMGGASGQTFSYDNRGLLIASAGPQGTSAFVYDAAGRMLSRSDAAGVSLYTWNQRSNLTSITAAGTFTQFGWYPSGELDTVTYPGNTARKYTYDDAGRVTVDETKNAAAATISKRTYGYNPDGTVSSTVITQAGNTAAGTYSYTYDRGQRLRSTTGPAGVTNYSYDPAGNRLSAGAQTFTYDHRNRLITGGGTTYNWSPRGTLQTTSGTGAATYNYDALDRMTQSGPVTYTYDMLDRVATRTQTASTTTFNYAGTEKDPVAEGMNKYHRTPSGESTHLISRNGTAVVAGTDRRGDVTFTLDTSGTIQDTTIREPWGTALGLTGSTPNIGYQSDWTDPATSNVWMTARWYQPSTGTFLTRDTYPGEVGVYSTLNRYTYGSNNPLMYTDPTGRYSLGQISPYIKGTVDDRRNISWGDGNVFGNGSEGNFVSGTNNQIDGHSNITLGDANAVVGDGNRVAGDHNIVVGDRNNLTGEFNAVQGDTNRVVGFGNAIYGNSNYVVGDFNAIAGSKNTVNGNYNLVRDENVKLRSSNGLHGDSWCDNWDDEKESILGNAIISVGCIHSKYGEGNPVTYDSLAKSVSKFLEIHEPRYGSEYVAKYLKDSKNGIGSLYGLIAAFGAEEYYDSKAEGAEKIQNQLDMLAFVLGGTALARGVGTPKSAATKGVAKCPGNSFRSDTEVVMADGSRKSISELVVGDEVIATDPETGLTGVRAVTAVHLNFDTELADLTVVDADGDVSVIHTTQHHPFWNVSDGKWTDVVDLDEGDRLRSVDGSLLTVVGLRAFTGQQWMWDLTIEGVHTYYVTTGNEEVLVHNCGGEMRVRTTPQGKNKVTPPKWVKEGPHYAEVTDKNPAAAATRIMDERYGAGNWPKGAGNEHSSLQKWLSRYFEWS